MTVNVSKNNLIASAKFKKDIIYLGILLSIAVSLLLANYTYNNQESVYDRQYLNYVGELRVLAQEIHTNIYEAWEGDQDAYSHLKARKEKFGSILNTLKEGDRALSNSIDLPATDDKDALKALNALFDNWAVIDKNLEVIVTNNALLRIIFDSITNLKDIVPKLQDKFQVILESILTRQPTADIVAIASAQSYLSEKILRNLEECLDEKVDADSITYAIYRDTKKLEEIWNKLKLSLASNNSSSNSEVASRLNDIYTLIAPVQNFLEQITKISPGLGNVKNAKKALNQGMEPLSIKIKGLESAYMTAPNNRLIGNRTGYILRAICLGLLLFLIYRGYWVAKLNLQMTEAQNAANQAEIRKLLDELADLGNGDLTVHATVSDGVTGPIAYSINYAVNALRKLVSTINETAVKVSSAAKDTQSTARKLAEASENQVREIVAATASINAIAQSIEQVSTNASQSTSVAENSVNIANNGAQVVQNTISGMERIREQIQETAKRIKRLGESSQEIGDTVSLIDDIADQTNILSLNAAIQAAMAGEAGRGFAVVADEVQRLAERSSRATKEIETLVKTIQTDTNQAVISMEQTTAEVVQGAKLAQNAGVALEQIEKVSRHLADLIQNISNAAQEQAGNANKISKTMSVIQEITTQTAAGTAATAGSIGNLAELSQGLRNSVAGFKLSTDNHDNN